MALGRGYLVPMLAPSTGRVSAHCFIRCSLFLQFAEMRFLFVHPQTELSLHADTADFRLYLVHVTVREISELVHGLVAAVVTRGFVAAVDYIAAGHRIFDGDRLRRCYWDQHRSPRAQLRGLLALPLLGASSNGALVYR
ncbi:hypothetical protein BCR43DRAFT_383280 [Syncephalastrum racemosum]|uniref:Uncharacterized protein n=1 Tax=Syncephalastrum racemosum TaxID=13706 RepID=A0A1X2H6P5_SYNRA|nr:hypothetical protein BCR43DRAFT_383280 [Syncephalastrum racemosum]